MSLTSDAGAVVGTLDGHVIQAYAALKKKERTMTTENYAATTKRRKRVLWMLFNEDGDNKGVHWHPFPHLHKLRPSLLRLCLSACVQTARRRFLPSTSSRTREADLRCSLGKMGSGKAGNKK